MPDFRSPGQAADRSSPPATLRWIADGRFQISKRAARSLAEDFQMPGIAAVDALEVPRARDDFRVRLSRARLRLQQEERFDIDLPAAGIRKIVEQLRSRTK